jgi:hypothetical protein
MDSCEFQNTTLVVELQSRGGAWLDLPYIGRVDNPNFWMPSADGYLAVHRVIHAPEVVEDGSAMEDFVKFMAA